MDMPENPKHEDVNEVKEQPKSTSETLNSDKEASEGEGRQSFSARDAEEAFKAATHGTDEAPHGHPTFIGDPKESTGRKADDSWKKKGRNDEV